MKITGTSSYILIEVDNKVVKVQGELLVNGFAAYTDTMKNWEPPHEKETIDSELKQKIIQEALDYTKDSQFKIEFV
ncbi:Imm74 family immunity protein [Bacillus sp. EB01]|uniref:Imm74 family immunity protein n=1 Tax=Bacillus sp. EB01 TaxID=1347086 RepID=UPI0005C5F0DC|nr:Imm74 family immunity protein [Bacillus sp. EB01]